MPRKKSRLERFLSFNQHRKRWGASKHATVNADFERMRTTLVDGERTETFPKHNKGIDIHLANLRASFAGKPELCFHHARLVVLIRREYDVEETFRQFRELWDQEHEFLCKTLSLRWLVSASDTFAEHDSDMTVRSIAMMVSVLATTIKIYETERFISGIDEISASSERIESLRGGLRPLFDGMSCFVVGTDDTLRNMHWRLSPFFKHGMIGRLAETVYDAMQVNDTAYARLRALHHRDRTGWW